VSDVTVRRAGVADWAALRDIRLESLRDTPDAYGSTFQESDRWREWKWRSVAAQWVYFLAERNGRVVGMNSGGFNDLHPGTHWMYGMYVTPDERGKDVAPALVDAVGQWARGAGATALYLHVTTAVPRARAFYDKSGFVATGERLPLDRDPSITLVTMVKLLG
jgi:GNAT superfamily N-acetyltransferase